MVMIYMQITKEYDLTTTITKKKVFFSVESKKKRKENSNMIFATINKVEKVRGFSLPTRMFYKLQKKE